MMILPNPGVLDQLIRERQRGLRGSTVGRSATRGERGLRRRVGHALIAAGSALSGERVEMPAAPRTLPRTA